MATYSGYTFSNMSRIGLDECSASQEDIYYPFRISLSKRYSFYRSRGY